MRPSSNSTRPSTIVKRSEPQRQAASARQIVEAAADARDGAERLHGLVRDLRTLSGDPAAPLKLRELEDS